MMEFLQLTHMMEQSDGGVHKQKIVSATTM